MGWAAWAVTSGVGIMGAAIWAWSLKSCKALIGHQVQDEKIDIKASREREQKTNQTSSRQVWRPSEDDLKQKRQNRVRGSAPHPLGHFRGGATPRHIPAGSAFGLDAPDTISQRVAMSLTSAQHVISHLSVPKTQHAGQTDGRACGRADSQMGEWADQQ